MVIQMQLDLTATTDLQRSTIKDANGAKKHNEHDPNVNHENVQIIKEDTKLNRHYELLNRDALLEEQFGKMIDERNEKTRQRFLDGKIGQNEYQNRLTTVEKYLNTDGKKPKQALTNYVFTLGNVNAEFQILDALGFKYERQRVKDADGNYHDRPKLTNKKQRQEFAGIMDDTYRSLAQRVNHSGSGLKIVDLWLHMDEGGMPHAQGEIVNLGHTSSGKPSYNLNQALSEFNRKFGYDDNVSRSTSKKGKVSKSPNGKLALKEFRRLVDGNMIDCFNNALKKRGLNKKLTVKGVRLGRKGGLSMQEYQRLQQTKEDLTGAYEAVTGHKAVNEDNSPLSPLETARRLGKASKDIEQQKKEAEAKEAENAVSEAELQQKIDTEKFNAYVRQHFLERLNQRRLQRLRQQKKELDEQNEGMKFQLVDTIRENDPQHKVEKALLKKGEIPQEVRTEVGRQQHKRQTVKYLFDIAKESLQKVKQRALAVVDNFVNDLSSSELEKANQLGNHMLIGSISRSEHPTSAKRERELMNDPTLKVRKALAMASNEQIKQTKQKMLTVSKGNSKDDGYGFGD